MGIEQNSARRRYLGQRSHEESQRTGLHYLDALGETDGTVSPEMLLWRAVVLVALEDILTDRGRIAGERHGADHEAVRAESWRWLTSRLDPWASARELVCQAAGLDAEWVRNLALEHRDTYEAIQQRRTVPEDPLCSAQGY